MSCLYYFIADFDLELTPEQWKDGMQTDSAAFRLYRSIGKRMQKEVPMWIG